MQPTELSLSFSISDNYAQHLAVVLTSALVNNPSARFVVHILHRNVTAETQAKLRGIETGFGNRMRLSFHLIDQTHFESFPLPLEHVSQETYYRYLLPKLLSDEERTLYLDVDLVIRDDLTRLWEWPLSGNLMAAVSDNKPETEGFRKFRHELGMAPGTVYINAGVMLLDLKGLRAFDFTDKCFRATRRLAPILEWPDQDVINSVLNGRIAVLPQIYNEMQRCSRRKGTVIRHFATFTAKPWCCLWKNHSWSEYLRYLLRSPYRDKAILFLLRHLIGRLYYDYTKKGCRRILILGIPVWRKKLPPKGTAAHV